MEKLYFFNVFFANLYMYVINAGSHTVYHGDPIYVYFIFI